VDFSITHQTLEGHPVVSVHGEVDVSSAPEVQRELDAVIEAGARTVVVDLSDVSFLDSTGLGALVAARAAATASGGSVAVVCDQGRLLKLFTITGLDGAFDIHPTVDEALRSLRA
jgi:anti-sigma B factor antagonist